MNAVHYSSKTVEWSTPPALFAKLDAEFGFTLDACATPENAKCLRYFTREEDSLKQRWTGVVWCNPPYGRDIARWTNKAMLEALYGATVVALLPAKTETRWWFEHVLSSREIRFLRGRIRFGGRNVNAPFPSAVVVWEPKMRNPKVAVRWYLTSLAERGCLSRAEARS
jgi:phage N-6-adenine-methyltransferase